MVGLLLLFLVRCCCLFGWCFIRSYRYVYGIIRLFTRFLVCRVDEPFSSSTMWHSAFSTDLCWWVVKPFLLQSSRCPSFDLHSSLWGKISLVYRVYSQVRVLIFSWGTFDVEFRVLCHEIRSLYYLADIFRCPHSWLTLINCL